MDWNVLSDPWLNVMASDGSIETVSPVEALRRSGSLQEIHADNPMDIFAAYRFLLTLLYWKADQVGGVPSLRTSLLEGTLPEKILDSLADEAGQFNLFDPKKPFLQDATQGEAMDATVGYLFSEFATGTNVAHFHHGDDHATRFCPRCLTAGMLRVIPWTQSGGAGKTPSVHNAPPLMLLAMGESLCSTLGLNLVEFASTSIPGKPTWSGVFKPTDHGKPADQWRPIPALEALTWNPRVIQLAPPEAGYSCSCCGADGGDIHTVGAMRYAKNENTKKPPQAPSGFNFPWNDPAAFYPSIPTDAPSKEQLLRHTTKKSAKEFIAFPGVDLGTLCNPDRPVICRVQQANPTHADWMLVIPCTDAANNKTYDVRMMRTDSLTADALDAIRVKMKDASTPDALEGWSTPNQAKRTSWSFLAASAGYTATDWLVFANAANCSMNESPEAFDLFSGQYWKFRRARRPLPKRNVLWLILKLMATVPASHREIVSGARYNPLDELSKTQVHKESKRKAGALRVYPIQLPPIGVLETQLRAQLKTHASKQNPSSIAWADLCDQLNEMLQ